MHYERIYIYTENGAIRVYPDVVTIEQGHGVRWVCEGGGNFDVIFQRGSPFTADRFDPGNDRSGPALPLPNPGRMYKYRVEIKGLPPLDPRVVVDEPD